MKYFRPEAFVIRMESEMTVCASIGSAPGTIEPIEEGELEE